MGCPGDSSATNQAPLAPSAPTRRLSLCGRRWPCGLPTRPGAVHRDAPGGGAQPRRPLPRPPHWLQPRRPPFLGPAQHPPPAVPTRADGHFPGTHISRIFTPFLAFFWPFFIYQFWLFWGGQTSSFFLATFCRKIIFAQNGRKWPKTAGLKWPQMARNVENDPETAECIRLWTENGPKMA